MTPPQPAIRRHVPQRTCVVCRSKEGKRQLVRIVRTEQGVIIDPTGKLNGRGAYLCHQQACWERAARSTVLDKALRTVLTEADREHLRQAIPAMVDG